MLSILAVICLCALAGIYFVRNVRVTTVNQTGGADVSIDTPGGHLNVRAHDRFDAAMAGVPEYPGARRKGDSGGAVVEWTSRDGSDKNLAVSGVKFETSDDVETVADWYRSRLPSWMFVKQRGRSVRFELAQGGYKHIVAIEEKHGHTTIGIAAVGEPAAN